MADTIIQDEHYHNQATGMQAMWFLFGVIALILLLAFVFQNGLNFSGARDNTPSQPQINVPDKVDINVKTPQQ